MTTGQGVEGVEALRRLREMFPDVAPGVLEDALASSRGDSDAAAVRLMEGAGAEPGEDRADAKRRRLEEPAEAKEVDPRADQPATPQLSWKPRAEPKGKPGGPGPASGALVASGDVRLPLDRLPVPLAASAQDAVEFSWASLKTKSSLQAGSFGPEAGSTWLWFLVAQLFVQARPGEDVADVRIVGDKFQAGWVPSPTAQMSGATLRKRHQSMLQSVLDGSANEYGSERGGTPEGFAHCWNYSDATWRLGSAGCETRGARWAERKGKDRWSVNVTMQWHGPGAEAAAGRYLLVAEQRAEKLNPNQYATAMRGAAVRTAGDAELMAALGSVTKLYASPAVKGKPVPPGGGLGRWLKPAQPERRASPEKQ